MPSGHCPHSLPQTRNCAGSQKKNRSLKIVPTHEQYQNASLDGGDDAADDYDRH